MLMSVRPAQTCLEQSIFTFLGQIREQSETIQRAIRAINLQLTYN